jgi:hypothetical protein
LPGVRPGGAAYVERGCVLCLLAVFVVFAWFVVCCGGLLGVVAVVFVVLCCLAWAVGVFDVPLWVPPLVGLLLGVGSEFYIGGFLCLWWLGGVLWSF